jgi:hypothetical protein
MLPWLSPPQHVNGVVPSPVAEELALGIFPPFSAALLFSQNDRSWRRVHSCCCTLEVVASAARTVIMMLKWNDLPRPQKRLCVGCLYVLLLLLLWLLGASSRSCLVSFFKAHQKDQPGIENALSHKKSSRKCVWNVDVVDPLRTTDNNTQELH